jgi:trehalose/maltose hydrolase-like predicted phosphorylase
MKKLLIITTSLATCFYSTFGKETPPSINQSTSGNGAAWVLHNKTFKETYANQPYIGNGYLGLRIPAAGEGAWTDLTDKGSQWPLDLPRHTTAVAAGYYADSPLGALCDLPDWSVLTVGDNRETYHPMTLKGSEMTDYDQSVDMQRAIVTTSATWTTSSGNQVRLRWTTYAHRVYKRVGIEQLEITPLKWNGPMQITAVIDLQTIERGKALTAQSSQDTERNTAEASMVCNNSQKKATVATKVIPALGAGNPQKINNAQMSGLKWTIHPVCGRVYRFIKLIGVATAEDKDLPSAVTGSDNNSQAINSVARQAISEVLKNGHYQECCNPTCAYNQWLLQHVNAWKDLWASEIVVDDQHSHLEEIIRACEYTLWSSLRTGARNSIAPCGLSSDNYAGMIFWDAETWMFPYLMLSQPALAKSIVDYRYDNLPNALLNVKQGHGYGATLGAYFPWVSTIGLIPPDDNYSDPELHLQSDIALAQFQYYMATGDKTWLKTNGWPVISHIADFWSTKAVKNPNGSYSIEHVIAPDEYTQNATDEAFTNGGALRTFDFATRAAAILGKKPHPLWATVQKKLVPPILESTKNIHLEYQGFNDQLPPKIKQADVVLLTYPMDYPMTTTQSINDLNFYAPITDTGGPGMTSSVECVIASQFGLTSMDAYFVNAYIPFVLGPYLNFNETHYITPSGGQGEPAFTFHTGEGGFLQALGMGFSGYRFREDAIYLSPILPRNVEGKPLTRVLLKHLNWQGRVFDVDIQSNLTTVTLKSGPAAPVKTPNDSYLLKQGQPLTLTTRKATVNAPTPPLIPPID